MKKTLLFCLLLSTFSICTAIDDTDDQKGNEKTEQKESHAHEQLLTTLYCSFISGLVTPLPEVLKNITRTNMVYSLGIHFFGLMTSLKQGHTSAPKLRPLLKVLANGSAYYAGQAAQFGLWKVIKSYEPKEAGAAFLSNRPKTKGVVIGAVLVVPLVVNGYLAFFKR